MAVVYYLFENKKVKTLRTDGDSWIYIYVKLLGVRLLFTLFKQSNGTYCIQIELNILLTI